LNDVDVERAEYGGEPNGRMWADLAVDALNAWQSTGANGEKKRSLQAQEFLARRKEVFA